MLLKTAWSHFVPVQIISSSIDSLTTPLHSKHTLLVTSQGFIKRGLAQSISKILRPNKITVWDDVKPNPDIKHLDAAISNLKKINIDNVIGLGGGSVLDSAKILAVALLPNQTNISLVDIFQSKIKMPWLNRLPLTLIPTTSGSGSEVTPFATIWDYEKNKKYSLMGDFMFSDVALYDPKLTLTLNEENTIYPALDSISHAIESLWNKNCTPITRLFATESLRLSNLYLLDAVNKPQSIEARKNLQNASLLSGLAISQTKTALAHSISYPLTTHYGVPHGLACSFTLPALLSYNLTKLSIDSYTHEILKSTQELLMSLGLPSRINKFLNQQQLLDLQEKMITRERLDNFCGLGAENLREILLKSTLR
ncbi:phosphonoacetaldehyde reductase [Polynucleobacter sp. MWH-CaK5]|uniref:phosphonoacetaldehyde reductase n=1 Tax=Polynucleobacter sp. MWH-CaK5 TaxID=2689107 RepID=UPI001BFD30EA|nr:phosphonoacetaldehyde reductase [Polynucleobacter sp. MWH-CaK5]QWD89156.1 phosphonoacetaldehyde reductase [Polynucleobacter sp. MWH-CaK5]